MFANEELNSIYAELEKQQQTQNRCLISNLDINEYNSVTLTCGHSFRIDFFTKLKNKNVCPYCSNYSIIKVNTCDQILKSGKNKGEKCNRRTFICKNICSIHSKKYL